MLFAVRNALGEGRLGLGEPPLTAVDAVEIPQRPPGLSCGPQEMAICNASRPRPAPSLPSPATAQPSVFSAPLSTSATPSDPANRRNHRGRRENPRMGRAGAGTGGATG
jgi:hypothetical protein